MLKQLTVSSIGIVLSYTKDCPSESQLCDSDGFFVFYNIVIPIIHLINKLQLWELNLSMTCRKGIKNDQTIK